MSRYCKDCGAEVVGRSDKLFCGDPCRSNFHNKRLAEERKLLYKVNSILKKNRKLLNEARMGSIQSKEELVRRGYDFSYFTHLTERNGQSVYYCYDIGFEEREGGELSVVRDQD